MKIKKFLSLLTVAAMMLTTCSVTALAADGDVAQIDETTYATLQDAVSAASNGATIKLIGDTENEGQLLIAKDITLDLNGKSLKSSNKEAQNIFVKYGKLTLTDSVGTGKIYADTTYTSIASHGVVAIEDGEMIMNGGTIEAAFDNPYNNGNFGVVAQKNATFTMNGGKIKTGFYCVSGNGDFSDTVININGGELYSTVDFAVFAPATGDSSVNVSGGKIVGAGGGIAVRSGKLNISDGYIASEGTGNTGLYNQGTGKMILSAINLDSNYGAIDAKISGGKVEALNDKATVLTVNNSKNKADVAITGGMFNQNVSEYVPSGVNISYNDGGVYVVNPVAEMNGKYYSSLQYAFDDVPAGGTVKLFADTDISNTGVQINKNDVTLNLAGHSIKAANTEEGNFFVYGGKLTLIDSEENGKIYSETVYKNDATGKGIFDVNNAEFVMDGGTIESVRENPADEGNFGIAASYNSNIIINGGTIKTGWYCVASNGANDNGNAKITVNGGDLTSVADYAIYAPSIDGITTITGGNIYGAAGAVSVRQGTLNITGGTLASGGDGNTGNFSDGTGKLANTAINLTSNYGSITANISGGIVTAPSSTPTFIIAEKAAKNGVLNPITLTITGGSYSSDPIELINSENYASVKGEELYTVEARNEKIADIAVMTQPGVAGTDGEKVYPITIFSGLKYLDYRNAGFEVTVNGATENLETTTAYNKITTDDGTYDKTNFENSSYVFGAILNLKDSDKDVITSFKVRPFATTQNGTKLYGTERTVNIGE